MIRATNPCRRNPISRFPQTFLELKRQLGQKSPPDTTGGWPTRTIQEGKMSSLPERRWRRTDPGSARLRDTGAQPTPPAGQPCPSRSWPATRRARTSSCWRCSSAPASPETPPSAASRHADSSRHTSAGKRRSRASKQFAAGRQPPGPRRRPQDRSKDIESMRKEVIECVHKPGTERGASACSLQPPASSRSSRPGSLLRRRARPSRTSTR